MLRAAGDERVAAQARKYFKPQEKVRFFGVKSAGIDEIEKEIFAMVRPAWALPQAVRFCDTLMRSRFLEAKGAGIVLLARFHGHYDERLLDAVYGWLDAGFCDNWATTDVLSTRVVAQLLRRRPGLLEELQGWTRSDCMWVRRAAAVSLTPLARHGEHLDAAYRVAAALLGDAEDLMHKAVGWLLRECGKTDPLRLESFLLAHGPRIPRTALRYAVERFPEAQRRRILLLTRTG